MARLLIIDDEKMICEEFCETLKDLGHRADYALNGDEALRKIEQNPYELVFLDLSMPRMSGEDVFKRIRERHRVPVTFMAGFMSPSTEKEVLSLGALRCLRKPVHLSEIVDLIDKLDRFNPQSN
jgi:DNA-binding response OmpR family regulator